MSFDLFVDAYGAGVPASISREAVRSAFGSFASEVDATCWRVRYDEDSFCELFLMGDPAEPARIAGFMVSGPCADERLWDALASILRLGAVVLHFEGRAAFAGRSDTVMHLPKEFIELFGEPRLVSDGREIAKAVEDA